MREQAPGANLLDESVSGASDMTCLHLGNQIGLFFSSTTVPIGQLGCFIIQLHRRGLSCVLVGVLTRERVTGACFRSELPRVYWP